MAFFVKLQHTNGNHRWFNVDHIIDFADCKCNSDATRLTTTEMSAKTGKNVVHNIEGSADFNAGRILSKMEDYCF